MDKTTIRTLRTHLSYISDTATMAQRVSPDGEDLCDVLDDIDTHLQAAIAITARVRVRRNIILSLGGEEDSDV